MPFLKDTKRLGDLYLSPFGLPGIIYDINNCLRIHKYFYNDNFDPLKIKIFMSKCQGFSLIGSSRGVVQPSPRIVDRRVQHPTVS